MTSTLLQRPAEGVADAPSVAGPAATSLGERALTFPCEGEQLLGVLHLPAEPGTNRPSAVGVVVVVGGPQVRAGSHRQFVLLARALAAAGYPVLRFDVRGMGDSTGELRNFEQISPDIGAAIDALMTAQPQLDGVVLWGLCDGASAALLYLHDSADPRVRGLCLLNPWVRSEATQAQVQVQHYYTRRLLQTSFWRKLLGGGVGLQALRGLVGSMHTMVVSRGAARQPEPGAAKHYVARMAAAWLAFRGSILLLLSADDFTAREFETTLKTHPTWTGDASCANVQSQRIAQADHTLSKLEARHFAEHLCAEWLHRVAQPSRSTPGSCT